ncbi:MAG: hypothetical protein NVSMB64_26080 [Candidatus Velthaea sp.]
MADPEPRTANDTTRTRPILASLDGLPTVPRSALQAINNFLITTEQGIPIAEHRILFWGHLAQFAEDNRVYYKAVELRDDADREAARKKLAESDQQAKDERERQAGEATMKSEPAKTSDKPDETKPEPFRRDSTPASAA